MHIPFCQVLSNGVYKSVEHRVMVSSTAERLSMAFFYNPRSDLRLGPIAELVTPDRPPLYQAMTFDEYRVYIRKNGPKGKTQVQLQKTVQDARCTDHLHWNIYVQRDRSTINQRIINIYVLFLYMTVF
jgi:2OG-Fe(II) oxygenase superfamily